MRAVPEKADPKSTLKDLFQRANGAERGKKGRKERDQSV